MARITSMKNSTINQKNYLLLTLIVLGTLLGFWYLRTFLKPNHVSINEIGLARCTRDIYNCSDGSKVGRSGPDCVFVCPGSVAIKASPNPAKLTLGQNYKLNLNAVPSTNPLTAIQLELTYDPTKIEIFGLDHSDYFPIYLVNPKFNPGKFETTLAAKPDSKGIAVAVNIGSISIKPLELGEHLIQFGSGTIITTLNNNANTYQPGRSINLTVYNQGDLNQDKIVNLFDYTIFVPEYGQTGASPADLNGDGKVDLFDYTIFVTNYGKTSP